jgi:hypothetical protein
MRKPEIVFEEAWSEVMEQYKRDWKETLESSIKEKEKSEKAENALKNFPEHFYSEADVEVALSCKLRNKLKHETYYKSDYIVRNQLRFSSNAYSGSKEFSKRLEKMEKILEELKIGKNKFIPDIVIDHLSNAKEGAFLLFAELTYKPDFSTRYNKKVPKRINYLIEKAKEEAKTLTAAIKAGVLVSGYICIISDDLVSNKKAIEKIEKLEKQYKKVKFLYGGMRLDYKLEILNLIRNGK